MPSAAYSTASTCASRCNISSTAPSLYGNDPALAAAECARSIAEQRIQPLPPVSRRSRRPRPAGKTEAYPARICRPLLYPITRGISCAPSWRPPFPRLSACCSSPRPKHRPHAAAGRHRPAPCRRLECGNQMVRQLADKADRIRQQDLPWVRYPCLRAVGGSNSLPFAGMPALPGALSNVDFPRWYNPQSRPAASRSFALAPLHSTHPRTCSKSFFNLSMWRRIWRRSVSSWVAAARAGSAPFLPPPAARTRCIHIPASRGSIYWYCASSTVAYPSVSAARCAKMSKISAERSSTVHLVSSSSSASGRRQLVIEQNKRGPRSLLQAVAPPRPLPSPMNVRARPAPACAAGHGCRLGSGGFGQRFQLCHRAFVCVLLGVKPGQDRPTSTARSTLLSIWFSVIRFPPLRIIEKKTIEHKGFDGFVLLIQIETLLKRSTRPPVSTSFACP